MAWVVDTCVLIDVLDGDPDFGLTSARFLDARVAEGLVVCPVSYIELAPAFAGDANRQEWFLQQIRIDCFEAWTWLDTQNAHRAWHRYAKTKRTGGKTGRRPVADIQIGAFAQRFQGLITRNRDDFAASFPTLTILSPA